MWHVSGRRETHAGFRWGKLKEGDQFEDISLQEIIILKWMLKKQDVRPWTGLIWLRMGTNGRLL
jgi:hypothetical protein